MESSGVPLFENMPLLFIIACAFNTLYAVIGYLRARAKDDKVARARWTFGLVGTMVGNAVILPVAIGAYVGVVPSVHSFMRPRDGNPYVVASHVVYALSLVATLVWVLAFDGADRIDAYFRTMREGAEARERPESFRFPDTKVFFVIVLAAGLIAELVFWLTDFGYAS